MQKQRVKNIETKKNYVASRVSKKESNVFLFFEVLLTSTNKENDDERYQTSFVSLLSNVTYNKLKNRTIVTGLENTRRSCRSLSFSSLFLFCLHFSFFLFCLHFSFFLFSCIFLFSRLSL
jgi:hypothetical protein